MRVTDKGCPGERLETLLGPDAVRAGCALPSGSGVDQNGRHAPRQSGLFWIQNRLLSPVAHPGSVAQTDPSVEGGTRLKAAVLGHFDAFGSARHVFEQLLLSQHPVGVFGAIALA